jgi:hypothetical protein
MCLFVAVLLYCQALLLVYGEQHLSPTVCAGNHQRHWAAGTAAVAIAALWQGSAARSRAICRLEYGPL